MSSDGIYGMTPAGCVERIRSYEVADSFTLRARGFTSPEVEAPEKGAIVGEGILSFTGNLSEQNRDDVMHAFLFATLVANKAFPREDQGKEWYYQFVQVMTDAGWLPTQKFYNDISIGGNSVRMDQLVLEILGAVVAGIALPGATSELMLKVAGSAISALKKRETALTLYERNVLENGVGGTAAGTCSEINGEVTLALGTVRFIRKNTSAQVLFADWDSRDVKLYRGESVFRKVPSVVERTRDEILNKLGRNAESKIADYEI
ncbi:hypothetical protein Q1W70_07210 [Pseudomonas kielensis]|jgi:hypothetical protein|uniref:hypothetical protein n=1 Tax=Pseudomonas kielensis TaxID=2762577 RepID=UPI00265DD792|nr:hypothetical protein [Pseudomonas kielensis]WKL54353.1 hypothetical protein Q1W70_07210 [Pseudomonas kielensis]